VRVDNFEGIVMEINARYTVIRSLAGRESIVPNELLITTRVENLSLADSKVWHSTVVSVGYDSDVDQVMSLLRQAALNQARVLREPAPSVNLTSFGADGLEFKVGFWIADPENGSDNLKSLINLDILKSLRENKIEIPYPQRVVHTVAMKNQVREAGSDVGII
jgi:small-conductance mechanosensitive channel